MPPRQNAKPVPTPEQVAETAERMRSRAARVDAHLHARADLAPQRQILADRDFVATLEDGPEAFWKAVHFAFEYAAETMEMTVQLMLDQDEVIARGSRRPPP